MVHRIMRMPTAILGTLMLAACAGNPIVEWKPSPEAKPPAGTLDTMPSAIAYANDYKQAVHEKITHQLGMQVSVNDTLLGLGLFSMGAALAKAHRDVYTAGAFTGTAVYLYGNQDISKTRLDIYHAGISATNCAVLVVQPLAFTPNDLREIEQSAELLRGSLTALEQARSAADTALATSDLDDKTKRPFKSELDSSHKIDKKALATLADASGLPKNVGTAAFELRKTVDKIAAQVDKLAATTVPEPSTVFQSLQSIQSLMDSIAPGVGAGTAAFTNANLTAQVADTEKASDAEHAAPGSPEAKAAKAKKEAEAKKKKQHKQKDGAGQDTETTPSANLLQAFRQLADKQAIAHVQSTALHARMGKMKKVKVDHNLRLCTVADSIDSLQVVGGVETLTFPLAADAAPPTLRFQVQGGVKNYTAHLSQDWTGVTIVNPRAGDSTFEVKVAQSTKASELVLVVQDSSNPPQTVDLKIKIEAAAD